MDRSPELDARMATQIATMLRARASREPLAAIDKARNDLTATVAVASPV